MLTHTYNLIYNTTLGGKTFHLFWVKAPLSQDRPALLCSKTAWLISRENEWFDAPYPQKPVEDEIWKVNHPVFLEVVTKTLRSVASLKIHKRTWTA